jgi:hypothetical protein
MCHHWYTTAIAGLQVRAALRARHARRTGGVLNASTRDALQRRDLIPARIAVNARKREMVVTLTTNTERCAKDDGGVIGS